MVIKVKERSEKDLFIRCNTKEEKEYVLMIFLELKNAPRMDDKIIVKAFDGRELRLKRKEESIPSQQPPFVEGSVQDEPTTN